MRSETYKSLPIVTLYELLVEGVKKLLSAYDSNAKTDFDAHRKCIEVFIKVIEEKKNKQPGSVSQNQ
jgi:hypothetical protein